MLATTRTTRLGTADAAHLILQTGLDMLDVARLSSDAATADYCRCTARRLHSAAMAVIEKLPDGAEALSAEASELNKALLDQGA